MAIDVAGLFSFGLEMVAISVRLGFEIKARSKRVEDIEGSWAYSVVGITATDSQTMLESFHERNVSGVLMKTTQKLSSLTELEHSRISTSLCGGHFPLLGKRDLDLVSFFFGCCTFYFSPIVSSEPGHALICYCIKRSHLQLC